MVLTTLMGGLFAFTARPEVCLRNPTDKPLTFFVDGRKEAVVEPGKHDRANIPYGPHEIGWSETSDTTPRATVDADLSVGSHYLVNPDEAGCFYLEGVAYGTAKLDEKKLGPLPLQTLYVFDKVDFWFEPPPQSIKTKQSGETRIAVQVYEMCTETMKACDKEKVRAALVCEREAKDDDAAAACWERSCEIQVTFAKSVLETVAPATSGKAVAKAPPRDAGTDAAAAGATSSALDAGPADAGAGTKKKKKKAGAPGAPPSPSPENGKTYTPL